VLKIPAFAKRQNVIANGRTTEPQHKNKQEMIILKELFILILTMTSMPTNGQYNKPEHPLLDTTNITFRDTIFDIAFDSTSHNLGKIIPSNANGNNKLVKHFKYLGTDTIFIKRTWTGDPHFICEYPREQLIPNKIYSFTVCFYHERQGKLNKHMGFELSDGNSITFKFTGTYLPIKDENE
jgi:hypothetical protein